MNAEQWNKLHPVGTLVFAYPGCRPEDGADTRLVSRTRSKASVLGGHTDVVWVDGHSACISLTHVDPVSEGAWEEAREAEKSTEPAAGDPHLSAVATIEKALDAYYKHTPTPQLTVATLLAHALCGERQAASAAYSEAAELVARYAVGTVEQAVLRDLATELRRKAREAS
ncbi:hypothetical protein [Streptomyces sp. NPDC000351]|uniref:hypothetical protein n=1 Tax=Streptomyces sp. NPDC000351 TaxID=3154250 RepID=UPI00331F9F7C